MTSGTLDCRSFEDRLALRLDEPGALVSFAREPHAAGCPACGDLVETLRVQELVFASLRSPVPETGVLDALGSLPKDLAARAESARVLELLRPGVLTAPVASRELIGTLTFLPSREKARRAAGASGNVRALGGVRRLLGDWRVSVAFAYAATLVLVTILKVDPLSVARGAASGLTATGERAFAEAANRLEESRIAAAALPLTRRLDYRVYRTVAAGRARASAYSQLVFEKVFGGAFELSQTRDSSALRPQREPEASSLRS